MDSAASNFAKTVRLVGTFNVLHIEPSVEASLSLRAEMRRRGFSFKMERVSSSDSAERAIFAGKWDLIISEYMLPMLTVEMVLAWLKRRKMDVPVIVFSEMHSDRALIDSMRAGARDYLTKDKMSDLLDAVERELQEAESRQTGSIVEPGQGIGTAAPPRILAPVFGGQNIAPELCGSETVLLVDDDPMFREFMCWTLRRHGYHVIQAVDGEEADYILDHYVDRIHAMVCDVIMPNLDGLELANKISDAQPDIKVIMVSGFNDNPLERGHRIAGRYPLVWKPFDVAKLLKMMREMLAGDEASTVLT